MALVTTQSKPFLQLVDLQQKSLDALNKIKDSISQSAEQRAADSQTLQLEQIRKLVLIQQESLKLTRKSTADQSKQIGELAKQMKNWKTVGDKLSDIKRGLTEAADPTNIKRKLLSAMNVGGMFDKKIQDVDYTKRQRALGSTRSPKELKQDAKDFRAAGRSALKAEEEINRLRKMGMSDKDIKQTEKGAVLFKQRADSLAQYNKLNVGLGTQKTISGAMPTPPKVQTKAEKGKTAQSTTDVLAEAQKSKENQLESIRIFNQQTDYLKQIAENTSFLNPRGSSSAGGSEDAGKSGGGSALGNFGKAVKGIGSSVAGLGRGIGAGIGGLIGGVILGIMKGIADGIAAFGSGKVLKGVAVMGLLTGVMWGLTEVIKKWEDIDWDTITKAGVALLGLVGIGFVAGKAFGGLMLGSLALAALGASVWVIGEAMNSMGDGLKNFVDGLERLSNLEASKLWDVAGGLTALGASFAAFGIGQAAAGLGNLVSRFLTIGTDSPVEQLIKIGQNGDGVMKAAEGLDKVSEAMTKFSKVDPKSMEAINDFPWLKATAFVAAGGAMSVAGAKVYNASKGNADEQAKVEAKPATQAPTTVSTAVQNNSTTNQIVKARARNEESSYAKYLSARYI